MNVFREYQMGTLARNGLTLRYRLNVFRTLSKHITAWKMSIHSNIRTGYGPEILQIPTLLTQYIRQSFFAIIFNSFVNYSCKKSHQDKWLGCQRCFVSAEQLKMNSEIETTKQLGDCKHLWSRKGKLKTELCILLTNL